MVDFVGDTIGLHVNGRATLVEADEMASAGLEAGSPAGRMAPLWVRVDVEEAYIHCSKHIPRLAEMPADEAAAARRARTVDYFGAAAHCDTEQASAAS
jgi:hypothetical protein